MTRVKKGVHALKKRKSVLKRAKGYRFARSKKERQANEALVHAGTYAFNDRRKKKNNFRQLWNVRISAFLKERGLSYSKFIGMLKKSDLQLNRKMLSSIAQNHPKTFEKIIQKAGVVKEAAK